MREIKFRAWDCEQKFMIEYHSPLMDGMDINALNDTGCNFIWMQYTGLKDKNGKEIYEGDRIGNVHNVVEFCNGSFCINGDTPLALIASKYEIINNIYEVPN